MSTASSDRSERPRAICWNDDKKHRCPACHAVTVDSERPRGWRVYTCCRCGARFTRWPRLAWLLPKAGVRCSEHAPRPEPGLLDLIARERWPGDRQPTTGIENEEGTTHE